MAYQLKWQRVEESLKDCLSRFFPLRIIHQLRHLSELVILWHLFQLLVHASGIHTLNSIKKGKTKEKTFAHKCYQKQGFRIVITFLPATHLFSFKLPTQAAEEQVCTFPSGVSSSFTSFSPPPLLLVVKRKETSNVIMKALYFSTDPSKLIAMADGRPFCRHHPAGQYSRPTFITSFLSSKSLLQSVHESLCSCSSRLFLSRVFNQIAFTTNLFCLSHILHNSELSLNRNLS